MARQVQRRRRAAASTGTPLPAGAVTNDVGVATIDDHKHASSPAPPVGDIVVDKSVSDGRVVCYRTPDSVVKDRHGDVDVVRVDAGGGLWVRCPETVRHCYALWTATDETTDDRRSSGEPTGRVSIDLSRPGDVVAVNMTGVKVLGSGEAMILYSISF
jgi:hypothetical protein